MWPGRSTAEVPCTDFITYTGFLTSSLLTWFITLFGLPWWLSSREPACQRRRQRFCLWVRKMPWRRKWQPSPVKSHGQRSLVGYNPWDVKRIGHKNSNTLWNSSFPTLFHLTTIFCFDPITLRKLLSPLPSCQTLSFTYQTLSPLSPHTCLFCLQTHFLLPAIPVGLLFPSKLWCTPFCVPIACYSSTYYYNS